MGKKILFYFTLFLFVLAICLNADKFDYDLWARLIAGMGVVDGGHVLKADFLSYTPVHVWYDHEWGSGVVFYLFLKYFGPFSLIILEWLLYSGIFVVISRIIKIREQASPYNILFYIFPIMALVENFNNPVRCHLFSFFLFTLFIYFLEYARKRGKNFGLWLIPPIIIIWTNTHGGVVSGIGLLLMYAVGEFLNRKPFKKYLITFAVSAPLTLINPWGFDYVKFLLMANTMKRPDIIEWWGIFSKFHMFKQIMFKLFMLGVIVIEGAKFVKISKTAENLKTWYENLDKTKIILLLSTAYLAVKHVKLLPFFVITGTIFGYEDFFKLIKNSKLPKIKEGIIYTAILVISLLPLCVKKYKIPLNTSVYPVKEVEFIKINNLKGNILANFGLGSFVSYKLYPNNLIFMDGRYEEVYFDYMVPLLKKFCLVLPGWYEIYEKFPPDIILIEDVYPVFAALDKSEEWVKVYKGEHFGVFVPRTKVKKSYKLPPDDRNYYLKTLFDTDIKFEK